MAKTTNLKDVNLYVRSMGKALRVSKTAIALLRAAIAKAEGK